MSEPSDLVCAACGCELPEFAPADAAIAESTIALERGLCANCASQMQMRSSNADQTITPDVASAAATPEIRDEQTLSVAPDSAPRQKPFQNKPVSFPKKIGRFEIEKVLGSGGFGTVYRAHDPLLDRIVALKVPRLAGDDPDSYERFLHEAKAAARLRHPNIVAVFECGLAGKSPYIAAEFVDGTPLSQVLKSGKLNFRQAVELVQQVAEAIDYAHSEGIVHRDLKPGNIMMSKSGRPQIMDFGLARLGTDSEMSLMSEGSIVGTPAYMAPEQARGDKDAVGPKSDQYSVGVLLYVMISGVRPYVGDAWSIISRVADPIVQPEAPRKIRKGIPRDLEACCLKAMEKDPQRRYDNLADMADDLTHWLEGRTLMARPISVRERLTRWCFQNQLIACLTGVITGLILTALVVGFVLAYKFSNLADYANERADAEQRAKSEVERVLIDTFTESGLDAGKKQNFQEAVLWFGSAAAQSTEHPLRERLNRSRFQTWLKQTPIPVRMFRGLGHWHESLIVHPQGNYVLSEQHGPGSQHCQIWHVPSGELWKLPWGELIGAATWSKDGTLLALAAGSEVRTFQFPEGIEVDHWEHGDSVRCLSFSDTGNRIAVGGEDSTTVRELGNQPVSKTIAMPKNVAGLTWSPSGSVLATLCKDDLVHVWSGNPDDANLQPLIQPFHCPISGEAKELVFLSDNLLIVPESENSVACWDLTSGDLVWSVPCGRGTSLTAAPDLSRIAIIVGDRLIQVDAQSGSQLGKPIAHPNLIYNAAYDSSGEQILTACADQFARVFSASTGELLTTMRHSDMVHRVAWFPGGKSCVTTHWKADLVRVWKLGLTSVEGFSQPLQSSSMHVAFSDDGSVFFPAGTDMKRATGAFHVYKTSDGSPVGKAITFPGWMSDGCIVPKRHDLFIAGSAVVADTSGSAHYVTYQDLSQPGTIIAANYDTGDLLFPPIETASNVVAIEASPDGKIVAALCDNHELLIIDATNGAVLHRHETFPGESFFYGYVIFKRIAFSPGGDRFAVWGSRSRTAEMRSAVDGELLFTVTHKKNSNSNWLHNVVFSPDGQRFATCSADHTVQVWDVETGDQPPIVLTHTGWVFSAEFSRDGKRLLTACQDKQARLWDLAYPGKPILATPAQADEVYATCFLPGEEAFLIGLRNGEVSGWDAHQGKMITPGILLPGQEATYTLALSPDQSRVIMVSRDSNVRGFPPSQWIPEIDSEFSRDELRGLGEMIAAEELNDGVLMGLTNESLLRRWTGLFRTHKDHPIFRWSETTDLVAIE